MIVVDGKEFESAAEFLKKAVLQQVELPAKYPALISVNGTENIEIYPEFPTDLIGDVGKIDSFTINHIVSAILIERLPRPIKRYQLHYKLLAGPYYTGKNRRFQGMATLHESYGECERYIFNLEFDMENGSYVIEPVEIIYYDGEISMPPDQKAIKQIDSFFGTFYSDLENAVVASQTMGFLLTRDKRTRGRIVQKFLLNATDIKEAGMPIMSENGEV